MAKQSEQVSEEHLVVQLKKLGSISLRKLYKPTKNRKYKRNEHLHSSF
jgi:hypothetical protein